MKNSSVYSSKLDLALRAAELDFRAVTIAEVTNTKPSDSREAFRAVNKRQSSSGQTPTYHPYFFTSKRTRMHAAYLLLKYWSYRMSPAVEADPNPHGMAFLLAFTDYRMRLNIKDSASARLDDGDDNLISAERMNLLIGKGYARNWRGIRTGASTCFEDQNGKLLACRGCKQPHFVEAHYVNYTCSDCE